LLVFAFIRLVTGSLMKLKGYFNLFLRFLNLLGDQKKERPKNQKDPKLPKFTFYVEKEFDFSKSLMAKLV